MPSSRPIISFECCTEEQLIREYRENIRRGYVTCTGGKDLKVGDACEVFIIHPRSGQLHPLFATVYTKTTEEHAICRIEDYGPEIDAELREFIGIDSELEQSTTPEHIEPGTLGVHYDFGEKQEPSEQVVLQPIAVVDIVRKPADVDENGMTMAASVLDRPGSVVEVAQNPCVAVEVVRSKNDSEAKALVPHEVGTKSALADQMSDDEETITQQHYTFVDQNLAENSNGEAQHLTIDIDKNGSSSLFDGDTDVSEYDTSVVGPVPSSADNGAIVDNDPHSLRVKGVATVQERLKNLPLHEVFKIARGGHLSERKALERIYGKLVWEPLLQNPNLTPPEVARIARMGNLPTPLIDFIVSHTGWLSHSIVRRALLSNPRLSGRAVTKVLRALPKPELQLATQQTAYPHRVREAAKRLLGR